MASGGYYAVRTQGWTWSGWTGVAAVGTLLAVIAAFVLAIWHDELRTLGRSPRLSLALDPEPDHFQRFITSPGIAEYDVRISVTNDGEIGARNVEVVGQELLVKGGDGQYTRDPVFMAMNLKRTHIGDTITPMVHRGVPRPYDLLACYHPDIQKLSKRTELRFDLSTLVWPVAAEPGTARSAPAQAVAPTEVFPSSKPAGSYRLVLAVAADGVVPVRRVVEIEWTGKWSDDKREFFSKELQVRLTAPGHAT